MSEEDDEKKGSVIKGVAFGCVLQAVVLYLTFITVIAKAISGPSPKLMLAPAVELAGIFLLLFYWHPRGESKTVSGFLIVIVISAIVLVPCWGGFLIHPLNRGYP